MGQAQKWFYFFKSSFFIWMKNGIHQIEKEGYLKIHVAVNIKTKEILALEGGDRRETI